MNGKTVPMAQLTPLLEEILRQGGRVEMTATGRSMEPLLHDRESQVRLGPPRPLRRGDIALYRRDSGGYVLHRVTAAGERYTCCGDAQWAQERDIRPDQIVAVAEAFTVRGRWVSVRALRHGVYWHIWLALRPVRRLVIGGSRRIRRLLAHGGGA